jgi:hypothetical protein
MTTILVKNAIFTFLHFAFLESAHDGPPVQKTHNIHYRIHNTEVTEHRIENTQNIEYKIQKLMYIKLLMYLFLYTAFDFDAGKYISRAIGKGGP